MSAATQQTTQGYILHFTASETVTFQSQLVCRMALYNTSGSFIYAHLSVTNIIPLLLSIYICLSCR